MHYLLLVLLLLGACPLRATTPEAIRKSVFKIHVMSQSPDYEQPWLQKPIRGSNGTGFYIGKEGIMTNAHVVAEGKFITVLKDGDDRPRTARVKYIAHDCDLALLEVEDPNFFKGLTPLRFADFPEVREDVNTIGFPTGGEQISITQGVVSRVSYRRYVHTNSDSHLLVQVDAAINPGNSGGPVLQKGKVVGVAFQSQTSAENTGYIIPTPVVQRFLDDIKDGQYDGHPVQGFWYTEGVLENEATRAYHGLKKGEGGVKITEIASYSPAAGHLQSGDILLSVGGKTIGVDGKIALHGERISLRALYDLKQRGDMLAVEILRDGQRKSLKFPLTAQARYYEPGSRYTQRPRFAVFSGLVFSALSRNYLTEFGRAWFFDAPLILRHLQNYANSTPEFAGVRDIVVLSERLAHPVNTYAGPFMEEILTAINGQPVKSVEDIRKIIDAQTGDYLIFEFYKQKAPLVLERTEAMAADSSINEQYRVSLREWYGSAEDDGATSTWEKSAQ